MFSPSWFFTQKLKHPITSSKPSHVDPLWQFISPATIKNPPEGHRVYYLIVSQATPSFSYLAYLVEHILKTRKEASFHTPLQFSSFYHPTFSPHFYHLHSHTKCNKGKSMQVHIYPLRLLALQNTKKISV